MGNSSSVISSPKGGGALSGMGEKFSPDLFTGTGNFSVPIAVLPGRNGFQPELTLSYSTGGGNSPFGLGWGLGVPGIVRKTDKGIPRYNDDKDVFILSGSEDLVCVKKEQSFENQISHIRYYYRPRTEGLFARIIHHKLGTGENYWEVRSKDGLISYYGNPEAIGDTNTTIAKPDYRKFIFAWKLYKTVDPFGNEILYEYERDLVSSRYHDYDQLYLKTIKYIDYDDSGTTKYLAGVVFNYEERNDAFSEHRAGFEIRTTKRCISIQSYSHPESADLPDHYTNDPNGNNVLVKTYHLNYLDAEVKAGKANAGMLPLNGVSLLRSVEVEGHSREEVNGSDEDVSEKMPPLTFTYSTFNPNNKDLIKLKGELLPAQSLSDPQLELTDLNGNGLPDFVEFTGNYIRYWNNRGDGSFDDPRFMKEIPAGLDLADPNVQLMDADGDGRLDVVVNSQGQAGYFSLNHNGSWHRNSFKKYKVSPSFSFSDPEVRMMDLSGNGITDVLRNGARFECYYQNFPSEEDLNPGPSQRNGWNHQSSEIKGQLDDFPNVSFADPRIKTGDMSGDGLQDIVMISSGSISYWPNLGYGKFGKKQRMSGAPGFPFGFNPARILLGDVDGDGLSDIVYVENGSITIWINQSGNGWSEPVTIKGTPYVTDDDATQLADIKGNGISGILWSQQLTSSFFFLDFESGNKPYLMTEMNNNMGAVTRTEYVSSSKFFIEDEKRGHRWKTTLPFPVQVVSKVEVIDEVSRGKLVTHYAYHHGYWDGEEREFRGFGRVDQSDTEVFNRFNEAGLQKGEFEEVWNVHYAPPTLTKNWFHLGPVDNLSDSEDIGFKGWTTVNFEKEYWPGDPVQLTMDPENLNEFNRLTKRAKRDVLRAMRGTQLRTEMYVLDGSDLENKPFTVSETLNGFRTEFEPEDIQVHGFGENYRKPALGAGSGSVFFSYAQKQRSSNWERGNEPLTTYSFTDNYDEYGQPGKQISLALPRFGGMPLLGTISETEYIYTDDANRYMCDRVKKTANYEIKNNGSKNAFELRDILIDTDASSYKELIDLSFNYYDGDEFLGASYGVIEDYGALVRTEKLVMTPEIAGDAYDSTIPCFDTGTPSWSAYPSVWAGELQGKTTPDPRLGYEYFSGSDHHEEGFYISADKKKYDFQETSPDTEKGLVIRMQDAFGQESEVTYDNYALLPVQVDQLPDDPSGYQEMIITSSYNYRILQAELITDENGNRKAFTFSPLGLMQSTAVMGKSDETDDDKKGDDLDNPSVSLNYDFMAWMDENDPCPVWVETIQRVHHANDTGGNDDTIVSREYSDGFGRLLQTRTQAEDVLFGEDLLGHSGLPSDQTKNGNAVGSEREVNDPLNVVVSGWQVYDNKGRVVEKYEPYFDSGFDYDDPVVNGVVGGKVSAGVCIKMYYDPAGRLHKTVNPDKTEQWVIFGDVPDVTKPQEYNPSPWVRFAYDANDLGDETDPMFGTSDSDHHYTPKSEETDALGRVIRTTEHNAHDNGSSYEDVEMNYIYDIRGNLLRVYDPVGKKVFNYTYDLVNQKVRIEHIDSGTKQVVIDAMGKPVYSKDAKGAEVFNSYDILNRPVKVWSKDKTGDSVGLRQEIVYGDFNASSQVANNLHGKPQLHYDEAGLLTFNEYDFKGNVLEKKREFIDNGDIDNVFDGPPADWAVTPFRTDWSGTPPNLESADYISTFEYDALNRIKKITLPEDLDTERKKITPTYNNAGALEKVDFDGNTYVEHIAYNAKGQRILIAHGNGVMTRYCYDSYNFRLRRQKTEKFDKTGWTYAPDAGAKQDTGYEYDYNGNILKQKEKGANYGITGSILGANELHRVFTYDPLNRLLSATGRESDTVDGTQHFYTDNYNQPGTYNAGNVQAYTRNYSFDKLGNIQQLVQTGTNGFTRNFIYTAGTNINEEIQNGSSSTLMDFTYDANGNKTTAGSNRNYAWDHADRLTAYYNQAGTSEPTVYAHYLYDAGGQRVKKVVRSQGGDIETIVYIDGIFEFRTDGTNSQNLIHVMDDQSRIARVRIGDNFGDTGDDILYNLEDHLGSSTIRLTTTGTVKDREEYYPFGDSSLRTWTKKRYRYTGKEKDEESGLYYYGARYYSAWTCRFISVDPLAGKFAFYSPYNYAGNKPIGKIDIDGKQEDGASPSPNETGNNSNSNADKIESKTNVIDTSGTVPNFEKLQYMEPGELELMNASDENQSTDTLASTPSSPVTDTKSTAINNDAPSQDSNNQQSNKSTEVDAKQGWLESHPPKKEFLLNLKNSSSSSATNRVNAAKKVINNYKNTGTTYSQSKRKVGLDVSHADCSSTVTTILKEAGQGNILTGTYTAAMQEEIKNKPTNNTFRKSNPKPGDIMMWGSHVTLVIEVKGGKVYFAHMGSSGPNIGSAKLDKNNSLKTESTWGSGGFIGFWTPN